MLMKVLLHPWVRAGTAVRKPKVQTLFQPPAFVLPVAFNKKLGFFFFFMCMIVLNQ